MIRVGFIGCGGITHMHMRDLKQYPDIFEVTALYDPQPAAMDSLDPEGKAVRYPSMLALLESDVDAVLIAPTHDAHEEAGKLAFAHGKHVLMEKPVARNLQEAETIYQAARKAGTVLLVGHNERYFPVYQEMKRRVDAGELGRLFGARADHFQNVNPGPASWWRSAEIVGGGCVIGSGIHRLDMLLWLLGEAEEVYARQVEVPFRLEGEALNSAVIRFRNGAVAEFFCNWGIYAYPYYESLSLFGEDGMVYYDGREGTSRMYYSTAGSNGVQPVDAPPCRSQWGHFADCILHGEKPLVGIEESRCTLALVEAIYLSARTGQPVKL